MRVRECKIKGLLRPYTYIELVGLNETDAKETLLKGVQRGRAKPKTPPPFPGAGMAGQKSPAPFPPDVPRTWQVPHARNPNFTGREDLLRSLRETLLVDAGAVVAPVLEGLGGVGKTQLALEYCYRYGDTYSLVWWLRAEEPTSLDQGFALLAARLGYTLAPDATPQEVIGIVRPHLESMGNWLLVFDNANGPESIEEQRPRRGGHVIVTSRDPNWASVAMPLKVKVFERKESVGFLLKGTHEQDRGSADALAEELGDLPLALEHARAVHGIARHAPRSVPKTVQETKAGTL